MSAVAWAIPRRAVLDMEDDLFTALRLSSAITQLGEVQHDIDPGVIHALGTAVENALDSLKLKWDAALDAEPAPPIGGKHCARDRSARSGQPVDLAEVFARSGEVPRSGELKRKVAAS